MKSILVIRLGRLGDVTLTGPTIKNLRFLYPRAHIAIATRSMYRSLARMLPGIDSVVCFPDKGSYFDLVELSSHVDDFNPELIVDLHKNFRSFHLANLTKAPYKVVYNKRRKERKAAVSEKKFVIPVPHTIDLYNKVIDQLKGERIAYRPDLVLPDTSWMEKPRNAVAVCPGASSPVKEWPVDRFAQLAERIIYDFKLPVHIFLGPGEESKVSAFDHIPEEMKHIHQSLDFPDIANIMSQCRLTITNDSGLMHVSASVGTPTAALFGPTHEQLGFYPRGLHDRIIATDEKCRPCSLHGNEACYREEQYCFTTLDVDTVYEYIVEMLDHIKLEKAVFLDRDGTVIVDHNYLADPEKIEFIPGALDAIARWKKAGYKIIIVSNQSGVARAFFTIDVVNAVHDRLSRLMWEHNAEPDDILFCPYHPDGDDPDYTGDNICRKPKPGMLEEAAEKYGLDLKRSYMIGDKLSDITCGLAAGCRTILVRTGKGEVAESELSGNEYLQPEKIMDTLADSDSFVTLKS